MVMSWKPVASSDNLNYEAQVRLLSGQSQDFQQVSTYNKMTLRNMKLRKILFTYIIIFTQLHTQVYKGPGTSCQVPITAFSSLYEARVRCSTTCMVNDLEEQLWSGHSSSVQCVCTKKNKEQQAEVDGVPRGGEGQGSVADGKDKTVKIKEPLSVQAWGIIVFVVLSVITLILAFVLGQYAM